MAVAVANKVGVGVDIEMESQRELLAGTDIDLETWVYTEALGKLSGNGLTGTWEPRADATNMAVTVISASDALIGIATEKGIPVQLHTLS